MTPVHLSYMLFDVFPRLGVAQHIFVDALTQCESFHTVVTVAGVFRLTGWDIVKILAAILPAPEDDAQRNVMKQIEAMVWP